MKFVFATFVAATFLTMHAYTQTAAQLAELWDQNHISKKFPSDMRHSDIKASVEYLRSVGLKVSEVGRSNQNREIYQAEFGTGPTRVFMWSQMHGDEPTATPALIDLLAFLQRNRDSELVKKIEKAMTIRAVPMLNPDGAEIFQRRNLQGIDINRDALDLLTPEARILKRLRDDWSPAIGFNLHNQQPLTTVGNSPKQAAISLLVVFGDAAKTLNPGQERNMRIASLVASTLQQIIPGHIARYGDDWTPTAFGDNFSAWGTPTILIETGALHGKDELYLVKVNFIAFLTAIQAIVAGPPNTVDPRLYSELPNNGSGTLIHYVFRGANIVGPAGVTTADLSLVAERRRASFTPSIKISSVGKLGWLRGLEEFDASGFTVVSRLGRIRPGELGELRFYKKDRQLNWANPDVLQLPAPDAIFSGGKFIVGDGLVPRR